MKFKKPIEVQAGISDGDPTNPLGLSGYLLSSDGSNVNWVSPGALSAETAEAIVQRIKADEALVKGDPVYIVGFNNGQNVNIVAKADSSDVAKMPVVGLVDDDYANNAFGTMTAFGSFNGNFDTTGGTESWAVGDIIFVKPGGGLTNIKPGGTDLIQNVAIVSRVNQNTGELEVIALGRTNDVPNLPTGRLFVGTAANTSLASDVVYVDDALDRVGIGTTSPGSKLEVAGEIDSVGGDGYLVEGLPWARGNSGLLELGDWDGVGYNTSIFGANGNLAIRTSGGNVGIGTTNPGVYRLAVAGPTNIGGNVEVSDGLGGDVVLSLTANTGSFQIGDIDGLGDEAYIEGDSSNIKIFTGGGERVRVNSSGNVGMGTTSLTTISAAVTTLSLGGTNTSVSGGIAFQVNGVVKAYNYVSNNYLFNQTVTGVGQVFYGASSERMRIHNTTGNIGVNTVSPFAKLHVASGSTSDAPTAGTATGGLFVSNINKTYGINMGVSGSGWSFIQNQRSDGNTTLYNLNLQPLGGNVGIGTTTPQSKLQVNGGVQLANDAASPSAAKTGTLRYRTSGNNSYVDMCMQTGASTYAWVNIVTNNW